MPVGYDALMRIMEADKVEVEPGDVLCLRTGFDRALLGHYADADAAFDPHRCSGLDGFDERLQRWVADSGVAALVSDNEAVEFMPDFVKAGCPRRPRPAPPPLPVQARHPAGRAVFAQRSGRLAPRGRAEPVPVYGPAAAVAGGGGVSGDGGGDGLRSGKRVALHLTNWRIVRPIGDGVEIESIRHKGLRRFFETGNAKGLVGDAGRLRKMLAFIDASGSLEELMLPPNFGLHELTGDRKGQWAMTVTRNWRMTFALNEEGALIDMDLEDYHGA